MSRGSGSFFNSDLDLNLGIEIGAEEIVPGKLILSGEHAVVYGHPVFAMAVNYHTQVHIEPSQKQTILLDLKNLNLQSEKTFLQVKNNFSDIQQRYQDYQQNKLTIKEVLQDPSQLIEYVLGLFLREEMQFKLRLNSTIPVGCGMGSSAAAILSSLYAIVNFFDLKFSQQQLFEFALDAENKQHGKSSGIDLRICLQGGALYKENNQYFSKNPLDFPLYLVNTGEPHTTTGECVAQTKHFFVTSSIGEDFAAVTRAVAATTFAAGWHDLIRQNHRLLVKIGVVPKKVQQFIAQIEQMNGAAKICGAGAFRGDNGGAVLMICDDTAALQKICQQFNYVLLPLHCEARGLHVI